MRYGSIWVTARELAKRHGEEVAHLVREALLSSERLRDATAKREAAREEIFRETEEEKNRRWEALERATERLNDAQMELASALGLPENATISQLTRAIYEARNRLASDREIQRFRNLFRYLERTIADGNEPLPGENSA